MISAGGVALFVAGQLDQAGALAARGLKATSSAALATTALTLLAAAGPALAQSAPANAPAVLEPVTVTGQGETATGPVPGYVARQSGSAAKTDTPIIETPQAVSVVGAEQIEAQGATSVVEAVRYTPGIRPETFGADTRNDWLLIRGFSAQETGYYLDGLQLFSTSFATWRLEPWGLERIEVLRGPSSVLYGGGNPGGLVNSISKRPPLQSQGEAMAGIDEYGNGFGAIDVGGPIGSSQEWFYRVVALGRLGDTQVDRTENDRLYLAPSLTWQPNDDTRLTLLGSYQRDKTEIQNFLPYIGTVVRGSFGRVPTDFNTNNPGYGGFEREQAMVGYEFEHRFSNGWTLRQNARYGHLEVDLVGLYGGGLVDPAGSIMRRNNFLTQPSADQFTVDTQAEWRVSTGPLQHKVLFGIDYKHYAIDDESGFEAGPTIDLANPVYVPVSRPTGRYELATTKQDQVGLYLQDQVKFDRFTLVLSGRHDWVSTDRQDDLFGTTTGDTSEGKFSGRAGLIYNFDNGLAPYVAYSTSFNPLVGWNYTTGRLLDPETGRGIEGGVKYQPPGWDLTLGAAAFQITRENVPTTDPANFQTSQIGEVRSSGVEFEAAATLMPGLDLVGAYTVYDMETRKSADPAAIGNVPVGVPEQFGSLWLDYTIQGGSFRGLGFGAGVRYVGRSYADTANTLEVPDYTVADAALHYQYNAWKVALNVTNVFDKTFVGSCSSADACFYGDRRKATLRASVKW